MTVILNEAKDLHLVATLSRYATTAVSSDSACAAEV